MSSVTWFKMSSLMSLILDRITQFGMENFLDFFLCVYELIKCFAILSANGII